MQITSPQQEVAKRNRWPGRVELILWAALGMLEILLGLRLAINLLSPNPNNGFGLAIEGITKVIIAPIGTLLRLPAMADSVFDFTTMAAMAVYVIVIWILLGTHGSIITRSERIPARSTLSM